MHRWIKYIHTQQASQRPGRGEGELAWGHLLRDGDGLGQEGWTDWSPGMRRALREVR